MKIIVKLILCLLCFSPALIAQTTNVSATVSDTDGTTWTNATWTATLYNPSGGQRPVNRNTGQPITTTYTGTTDVAGNLAVTLTPNTVIDPSGTQWQFTVCSNTSAPCSTVSPISISGASQSISAQLSAGLKTPRIDANGGNARAYGPVEINTPVLSGASYFNTTNLVQMYYFNGAWSSGALPEGCSSTSTGNLNCSGTGTFNTVAAQATNLIGNPLDFGGSTADAQIAACFAVYQICDARSYGATNQTISSTVSIGISSHQTLLLDQATTYIPASSTTTLFILGAQAEVHGLHIDASGVSGYSVPAVMIQGPLYAQDHFSISDFQLIGPTSNPASGSAGIAMVSASSSSPVSFLSAHNIRIVGFYSGVLLQSSGSGYVNGNSFTNLSLLNAINGIDIQANSTTSGSQTSGNVFANVQAEASGGMTTISMSGVGPIVGNTLVNVLSWDGPSPSCTITAANAKQNYISGWLQNGCNDSSGQLPPDANTTFNTSGPTSFMIGTEGGASNWLAFLPTTYGDSIFFLQNTANLFCLGPGLTNSNALCLNNTGTATASTINATSGYNVNGAPLASANLSDSSTLCHSDGTNCQVPTRGVTSLGSGAATVSTSAACTVGASCVYKLANCGVSGTPGILSVGTVTAGTQFEVLSTSTTDASAVCWQIN